MTPFNVAPGQPSFRKLVFIIAFSLVITVCLWINLPWRSHQLQKQFSTSRIQTENVGIANSIVIYNRVPKTGGTSFVQVVYNLTRVQHFIAHYLLVTSKRRVMNSKDVRSLVKNITATRRQFPALYHGHFPYVELEKHGVGSPVTYINVIRNPLERLVSYYYFLRFGDNFRPSAVRSRMGDKVTFDQCVLQKSFECSPSALWLQIPFFCGGTAPCWEVGSSWALDMAKRNLMEKYLLVGVSERMGDFVRLIEVLLPEFFRGAGDLYFDSEGKELRLRLTISKPKYNKATLRFFQASSGWQKEQEFYEFALAVFKDTYDRVFKPDAERTVVRKQEMEFKKIMGPS